MNINLRKVRNSPYKLVLYGPRIVGMFERRDHKEVFIDPKHFVKDHIRVVETYLHACTLVERLENAKI